MAETQHNWQAELKNSFRTPEDLRAFGIQASESILAKYKFLLPRYYASLIDKADPLCPIGLQALPSLKELESSTSLADPLLDLDHQPTRRITHRYHGRVLLHLTPNCSMYCRFCFRKTLLNELKSDLFSGSLEEALDYIKSDSTIEEVIFSGGDPLMASDEAVQSAVNALKEIKHIERVRFHTRVPVTFPVRVTNELAKALTSSKKQTVVVTHFNHPKELTREAREACAVLKETGITLLNQSVLLKHVNDNADTLCALSKGLFSFGILPYYLHQRDNAEGTDHFEVTKEQGREIFQQMKKKLSGYLVPRYVQDVVGAHSKSDIC